MPSWAYDYDKQKETFESAIIGIYHIGILLLFRLCPIDV